MIIAGLLNIFKKLLYLLFGWINLPDLPDQLTTTLNNFLDMLFQNAGVVGFFIRPTTLTILIPLLIIIINFEKIWDFTMFILRKIPMFHIS